MVRDSPQETNACDYIFRSTLDLLQHQHIPTGKEFFRYKVIHFLNTQNSLLQENSRSSEKFLRPHPFQSIFQQKKLKKQVEQSFFHTILCIMRRKKNSSFFNLHNHYLNFFPLRRRAPCSNKTGLHKYNHLNHFTIWYLEI